MCVAKDRETLMPSGSAMAVEEEDDGEALMEEKREALRESLGEARREGGEVKKETDGIVDETVMTAFDGNDGDDDAVDLEIDEENRFSLTERAIDEI